MSAYYIERARRQFAARDLAAALDSCRLAVEGEASNADAWFLKATLEMALGRRDEAVASASRATELAQFLDALPKLLAAASPVAG